MKNVIYVTGHKNPDSDSVCAAYGYAEFKNKIDGTVPATPVRLGNLNRETEYIFNHFKATVPEYLETVKLKVGDLDIDNIKAVSPDISLKKAWHVMKDRNVKSLPVCDNNDHLVGIITVSNLTSSYMDIWDNVILSKSNTTLDNIIETLSAKEIYRASENPKFPGKITVVAMQPDTMKGIVDEGDIAIVGDREESQEALMNEKVSLIIITGSHTLSDNLLDKAKKQGVNVISTPHDSFTASRLIVQSIPVSYVMTKENLVSFSVSELVEDIKDTMIETRYSSYPVTDLDGKVIGTISRYHLISNKKKKLIQVDHNERGQSVDGIEEADVLEIIDHHRVADIQTSNPIYFRNEPLGSSSTIVAKCFFENGIRPSKEAAGLLCGAIISDTLLFRSPTCTDQDKHICKKLADIAGISSIDDFAKEMFKAGTSLQGKTVEEIFNQDFKPFNICNTKIGVAQVNTMDIEGFMPLKEEMLDYMNEKASKEGYDMLLLLLTDILTEGSQILTVGDTSIVEETFNVKLQDETAFLPGVLSRKKQVIPPITNVINNR